MRRIFIIYAMVLILFSGSNLWAGNIEKLDIAPGLPFLFTRDTGSKTTVVHFLFRGGKKADPAHKSGTAQLATGLSTSLPDSELLSRVMQRGSGFKFQVGMDYSLITMKCLSEHLEETLEILATVLKKPLFSGKRIGNMKKNMLSRGKSESDDPARLFSLKARAVFFPGTSLGESVYGDKDSHKSIKKKDIIAFHQDFFAPGNMIVSAASDLPVSRLKEHLHKHFKDIPRPAGSPNKAPKPVVPGQKVYTIAKERKQTLIGKAVLMPGTLKENFARCFLLENLLGKGIGSRLWKMRREYGLSYSMNAAFVPMAGRGILEIYIKVDGEDSRRTQRLLDEILGVLHKKGLEQEEFRMAKAHAKADFLRMNETKSARALTPAVFELLGLGLDFYARFPGILDNISLVQMNRFIKEILNPKNRVTIIIGPQET